MSPDEALHSPEKDRDMSPLHSLEKESKKNSSPHSLRDDREEEETPEENALSDSPEKEAELENSRNDSRNTKCSNVVDSDWRLANVRIGIRAQIRGTFQHIAEKRGVVPRFSSCFVCGACLIFSLLLPSPP